MMLTNIGTVALLLCFGVSAFGMATFRVGNQTFQYHTQDLFEIEVAPYTTRGVFAKAVFNPNSTCEISPRVLNIARAGLNNVKSDNITSVIIGVDSLEAKECGCKTIAHAGVAVSKLKQYLNSTKDFSIDTALYISNTKPGPSFGASPTMSYTTYGFSFYEGASPVNIALLPLNNYLTVLAAFAKLKAAIIVTVEEGN
ncbi:hypothetical protein BDF19DRAFT_411651 [Syncephalis fuscata]|nr:hypothetical protein BDF19DRAFT_411651 [Syncephalis fuscata]